MVDQVYDRFLAKLVERASRVRPGPDPGADFGPITLPRQLETIQRHLDDALARGARALVGGRDAVRPPYVEPVVLVDVPADALVLREETFGPVLPVVRPTMPATPSPWPTPTPTAWARPCSPPAGPSASPAPCARAWPASTRC